MRMRLFRIRPSKIHDLDGFYNMMGDLSHLFNQLGGEDLFGLLDVCIGGKSHNLSNRMKEDADIFNLILQINEEASDPDKRDDHIKLFYLEDSEGYPGLAESLDMIEISGTELETLEKINLIEELEGDMEIFISRVLGGTINQQAYMFTSDFRKTVEERIKEKLSQMPSEMVSVYFDRTLNNPRVMGTQGKRSRGVDETNRIKEFLIGLGLEILNLIPPIEVDTEFERSTSKDEL